jgi:hypothetical protein
MSVRALTPAIALACVVSVAPAAGLADGLPYRGRDFVQVRTYGPPPVRPAARAAAAPAPAALGAGMVVAEMVTAPIEAVAVDGMKPLSQEDLAGAMGDGATRERPVDGADHSNVLKIGGRTSDSAASRIEGSTFTRFHPEPAPQAPEGLSPIAPLGAGGVGFTIVQTRGF